MSKRCARCGSYSSDEAFFCTSCGAKLDVASVQNTRKSNNGVIYAIIGVSVFIFIAFVAVVSIFVFRYKAGIGKAINFRQEQSIAANNEDIQKEETEDSDTPPAEQGKLTLDEDDSTNNSDDNTSSEDTGENKGNDMPTTSNALSNLTYNTYNTKYIIPDSDTRKLTEEELANAEIWQLALARNEIFARHGYIFKNDEYQVYFSYKDWYSQDSSYKGAETDIEKHNVELIQKIENEKKTAANSGRKITGEQAFNILLEKQKLTVVHSIDTSSLEPIEIYGEKFYTFSHYIFSDVEGDSVYAVSESTGKVYMYDVIGAMVLVQH